MNIKDTLFKLTEAVGTSGDEQNASQVALDMLKQYSDNAYIDGFGNVIGNIGKVDENKPTVLLDAHIDEIGLVVNYITDDGFLKVSNCGGVDTRVLLAQQVTVFGNKKIKGVITSTPPHLEKDSKSVPKIEDVFVDIGYTKEQASEIVSLGDRVIIDSYPCTLNKNRVMSRAIDDRSGVASILYALDLVKNKELNYNVAVLFSAQEETGERGAKVGAYTINPDLAIAVDVSFALTPDDKPYKCGKMSEGVMIGIAASLSKEMSEEMINLAEKSNISYQKEVMGATTGTNADAIGVTRSGVKSVTLSIPLKYMHTPIEVVDTYDIICTSNLIADFLVNGGVK